MGRGKAFLRLNSLEIRDKLEVYKINLCPCAKFDEALWLSTSRLEGAKPVHGIGSDLDIIVDYTPEKELERFLKEESSDYIDCGENVEMFINLAALNRPDSEQLDNGKLINLRGTEQYLTCRMRDVKRLGQGWRICKEEEIIKYYEERKRREEN